jgi:hypothetical protein
MDFFKIASENFFSILASKNKEIYLEALFTLRKAYKQEMLIKKDDLVIMLISKLEDKIMEMDLDEEEITEEVNFSSLAHFIIRKLKWAKWIDSYENEFFEEIIVMNDYSIKILNVLNEIMDNSTKEYNSLVFSTYSTLKLANEERNVYTYLGLTKAYENTHRLLDELKSLLNNIRRYHQLIIDHEDIKKVFENHFVLFKQQIADKIIHPLKTFDSIPRYKNPILNILKEWMIDQEIREIMVDSAIARNSFSNRDEAIDNIIIMMGEIIDIYESINELMDEIDRKNTAYTRATVEKIQYLLNTDRSVKGKVIEILKSINKVEGTRQKRIMDSMIDSIRLFEQGYLDEFSPYTERIRKQKGEPLPLPVDSDINPVELNMELEDFKKRMRNSYSHNKIMEFIKEQLRDKDEISTQDINIDNDDSFIKLLLAVMKHNEKNTFYDVDFFDNYVLANGYRLPNMMIRKKVR